jgi:hypothetical protein
MPAELMSGAVAVRADPRAQLLHFNDQLIARHRFEILVHDASMSSLGVSVFGVVRRAT